ncbi:uncharacterized protein LOC125660170 [Ostrea edulis]|uniref:uncharacterized protein LOC125660170 n=1 Tax=Ostrea edulis TaxID=37623 RepID=UPI0024AE90DB|nr:uncharacterized protein LOC125660170 [Ostrea edulis]
MRRVNTDVVGDKPVRNDAGEMSMSEEAKQQAWFEHYKRLLNVEFEWDPGHLSDKPPLEGPPIPITIEMVKKAIAEMKTGKAPGPSGVVVEMMRAAGDSSAIMLHDLAMAIIRRGTTDAIFVVRQLHEKYLAVNERLYMAFVDLEKAFDRVPRQVIWWALRKLGVEEWIVKLVQKLGRIPMCHTGVGSNSIHCKGCKHWVHKKCSSLKHLKEDPNYRCPKCLGTARPIDGRPQKEVQVGTDKLEVVASFCYLGDMLSAAGGCVLSTITRVKTAWNKFRELMPILSSRHLSYKTRGRLYSTYVQITMLYASETWPLPKPDLRLGQNDRAMVRQICRVEPEDMASVRSSELLARLGIDDLDAILREKRLRWFGHVARSSGAINNVFNMKQAF